MADKIDNFDENIIGDHLLMAQNRLIKIQKIENILLHKFDFSRFFENSESKSTADDVFLYWDSFNEDILNGTLNEFNNWIDEVILLINQDKISLSELLINIEIEIKNILKEPEYFSGVFEFDFNYEEKQVDIKGSILLKEDDLKPIAEVIKSHINTHSKQINNKIDSITSRFREIENFNQNLKTFNKLSADQKTEGRFIQILTDLRKNFQIGF